MVMRSVADCWAVTVWAGEQPLEADSEADSSGCSMMEILGAAVELARCHPRRCVSLRHSTA